MTIPGSKLLYVWDVPVFKLKFSVGRHCHGNCQVSVVSGRLVRVGQWSVLNQNKHLSTASAQVLEARCTVRSPNQFGDCLAKTRVAVVDVLVSLRNVVKDLSGILPNQPKQPVSLPAEILQCNA